MDRLDDAPQFEPGRRGLAQRRFSVSLARIESRYARHFLGGSVAS